MSLNSSVVFLLVMFSDVLLFTGGDEWILVEQKKGDFLFRPLPSFFLPITSLQLRTETERQQQLNITECDYIE